MIDYRLKLNMNSKKPLITIVIIIVVLVAGVLLWKGSFFGQGVGTVPVPASPTGEITPATQPGTEGQTGGQATGVQTEVGSIGKMTDEIYVEVAAQTTYQTQKDPASWMQGGSYEKLLNKYGVTNENMDAYADQISKDPERAQEIAQKYAQRLVELQQTGK